MMLNDVVNNDEIKPEISIMEQWILESKKENKSKLYDKIIRTAEKESQVEQEKEIQKNVNHILEFRNIDNYYPEKDSVSSSIVLSLENDLILKLKDMSLQKFNSIHYCSQIIQEQIKELIMKNEKQQHVASLSYNRNTKIRKDVLLKFEEILSALKAQESWPEFSTHAIKNVIISILETHDDRTINKYLESIDNFLKQSGDSIGLKRNSPSNLSQFSDAIENKLSEIL